MDASSGNKVKYCKIYMSYIFYLHKPQGHVMTVKCEQPWDKFTVKVWLLDHHQNLKYKSKYCTLYVDGTQLWTTNRLDMRTDNPTTICPQQTFQTEGINSQAEGLELQ